MPGVYLSESTMVKAEAKSVLVSHLQRNKVLKVPATNERGDLKFLEEVFRKEFQFDSNVSLVITFQHFDRDWEQYVDLDDQCFTSQGQIESGCHSFTDYSMYGDRLLR